MIGVTVLFIIVLSMSLAPFVWGICSAIIYKIKTSNKSERAKNGLINFFNVFTMLMYIILAVLFWLLSKLLNTVVFGGYIMVIIYTLVLGILSSESVYHSPKQEINSAWDAFKKCFTKENVDNFWAQIPLNIFINTLYLLILILAQVSDLGYFTPSENGAIFLTLNKYGIVILFAVQKIIKSVIPDKARAKIMTETFVENEKEEERQKQIRKERKVAKKQQKKDNDK